MKLNSYYVAFKLLAYNFGKGKKCANKEKEE